MIGLIDVDGKLPIVNRKIWSKEEECTLIECYKEKKDPREIFPYRSYGSIFHKASRLGLKWFEFETVCKKCGVELTTENWYQSSKNKREYICKQCVRKKTHENKKLNPERTRKWFQENYLNTKGGNILCRKRPKLETCELCGSRASKAYHHWGKAERNKKVYGIWLCHTCHQFAEVFDRELSSKYIKRKEEILHENIID